MFQGVHRNVPGQVVDPVEGQIEGHGQGLRRADPDQKRPSQARSAGHRDCVEVARGDAGGVQGPAQGGDHRLQVGPGGDLGDHPAEACVFLDTAGHLVGEQAVPGDDADPGLVARGFDAKHEWLAGHLWLAGHPSDLRITSASTSPGW